MTDRDQRIAILDPVEQASLDSFPASDPPGWIVVHPGPPAAPIERARMRCDELIEYLRAAFERAATRLGSEQSWPEDLRVWDIVRLIRERSREVTANQED